jgi:hypothetical protein
MALAMIYPEPKRRRHSELGGLTGGVTGERLSRARAVLSFSPELAHQVMVGPPQSRAAAP